MDFMNLHYLILSLLLACSAASDARPIQDCALLSKALPGRVWFPDSPQYSNSVSSYWFKQARLLPSCIVRPVSVNEVSLAVRTLAFSGSPFAVRGGGHGTIIGASNVKDGVTVDLRSMNAVSFNQKTKVVGIGAGALSDDVYQALDPYNVTALGGRVSSVGMGGFLTGGIF
jgi:FAD/FMN-containing dehydrogenase